MVKWYFRFRGFGFDRKNFTAYINKFFMVIFVHIPKLYVNILGDIVSMWFYVTLLHIHVYCTKTQKEKITQKT